MVLLLMREEERGCDEVEWGWEGDDVEWPGKVKDLREGMKAASDLKGHIRERMLTTLWTTISGIGRIGWEKPARKEGSGRTKLGCTGWVNRQRNSSPAKCILQLVIYQDSAAVTAHVHTVVIDAIYILDTSAIKYPRSPAHPVNRPPRCCHIFPRNAHANRKAKKCTMRCYWSTVSPSLGCAPSLRCCRQCTWRWNFATQVHSNTRSTDLQQPFIFSVPLVLVSQLTVQRRSSRRSTERSKTLAAACASGWRRRRQTPCLSAAPLGTSRITSSRKLGPS